MVGYGYIRYDSRANVSGTYHMPELTINWILVWSTIEGNYTSLSIFEFLKPGDRVNYTYNSSFTSMALFDYY